MARPLSGTSAPPDGTSGFAGTDPFPHVAHAEDRTAASQSSQTPGEARRHGAVPRHPQRQAVITARFQRRPDRTHAVRRVGETVNLESAAGHLADSARSRMLRFQSEPRSADSTAAAVVAIGRRRRRSGRTCARSDFRYVLRKIALRLRRR